LHYITHTFIYHYDMVVFVQYLKVGLIRYLYYLMLLFVCYKIEVL
jgi:hypothetical protein